VVARIGARWLGISFGNESFIFAENSPAKVPVEAAEFALAALENVMVAQFLVRGSNIM
jgi:hypothetical protein